MGPHAENFDGLIVFQNLLNKTVLKIDATGTGSGKVSNKLFIWEWCPKGVFLKNVLKCFCVRAKIGGFSLVFGEW